MDEKQIEVKNISDAKKAFEYEMTEVILKLRGEFASFSKAEEKKQEIIDSVKDIKPVEKIKTSEIDFAARAVDCPVITPPGKPENTEIEIEAYSADISLKKPAAYVPESENNEARDIKLSIDLPKLTRSLFPEAEEIKTDAVNAKIPSLESVAFKNEKINSENISLEIPQITGFSDIKPASVTPDEIALDGAAVSKPALDIKKADITLSLNSTKLPELAAVDFTGNDTPVITKPIHIEGLDKKAAAVPEFNTPVIGSSKVSLELPKTKKPGFKNASYAVPESFSFDTSVERPEFSAPASVKLERVSISGTRIAKPDISFTEISGANKEDFEKRKQEIIGEVSKIDLDAWKAELSELGSIAL